MFHARRWRTETDDHAKRACTDRHAHRQSKAEHARSQKETNGLHCTIPHLAIGFRHWFVKRIGDMRVDAQSESRTSMSAGLARASIPRRRSAMLARPYLMEDLNDASYTRTCDCA